MKILIAEDNPDNMEMLARRLRRKGYEVYESTTGAEAVAAVAAIRPNLVLMDISMPVMSGLEAIAEIRKNEQEPVRTPIIALTAHAMESDKEKSFQAGCDAFATKPVNFSELLKTIQKIGMTKNERCCK